MIISLESALQIGMLQIIKEMDVLRAKRGRSMTWGRRHDTPEYVPCFVGKTCDKDSLFVAHRMMPVNTILDEVGATKMAVNQVANKMQTLQMSVVAIDDHILDGTLAWKDVNIRHDV